MDARNCAIDRVILSFHDALQSIPKLRAELRFDTNELLVEQMVLRAQSFGGAGFTDDRNGLVLFDFREQGSCS